MTDDLLRRFGDLNPVPDPDRFVALGEADWPADPVLRAVLEEARTTNGRPRAAGARPTHKERLMTTLSPAPSDEDRRTKQRRSRRGWLFATAGAAIAVLAVAGVLTMTDTGPSGFVTEPAPPDPEAEAVALAEAYVDARNAFDVDRARELVADDFTTSEYPDGWTGLDTMELAFETHEAYGFHYSEAECTPESATSDQIGVGCDFLWTTELHRIGDHAPTQTNITVFVEDGRIARIARGPAEIQSWWGPFFDRFLLREHPEFRNVVSRALDLELDAHREVVERLPEIYEEYEAWVRAQG